MTDGRKRRWRLVGRILVIVLFLGAAGAGAAEAYIESVDFPALHAEPQASVLYYRDGKTIMARVGTTDHSDVALSAVPEAVRRAVLAAEDRDFYDHGGVSLRGVARAIVADVRGGGQGASTITQQYVRNAYLSQEVTFDRKVRELALSVRIERRLSKDQILERYLNTIYFGRGAYGIAAAAHAYFGVRTDQLTAAQGAVLAATVKDPWGFDPANKPQEARWRFDWIVNSMRTLGWVDGAVAYPSIAPANSAGPDGAVVDQVEQELVAHGVTGQELHTRGLTVITTLDATAQKAATQEIKKRLAGQPSTLRAALVAVDPKTGGVRAYHGGSTARGYYDFALAAHPAAATFKPIVLAAALANGIGYQSRWDGSSPRTFTGRLGVPLHNSDDLQCPDCTLQQAMVESLNTPFYAVTEQLGAEKVRNTALDLGVPSSYGGVPSLMDGKGDPQPGRTRSDIALGRYAVAPADLATVYATFAAGGVRHDRHFVQEAREADGRALWQAASGALRVLDPGAAADVSTVLGATVRGEKQSPGRPAAGKTGTQQWGDSSDNQDAWMVGYTPDLAAAVWVGKAVPGPIRDAKGKPIEGKTLPSRVWRDFVSAALRDEPITPLPKPGHVGRTDVGDAGKSHTKSPDEVSSVKVADSGYEPVVRTAHSGKRLALTFDDGPSDYTPQVLDLLKRYHIKATFCMVGENVTGYPQTVRRIVAEGHALCNHSMHHDDLGTVSPAAARSDIEANDAAIAAAAPGATVTYYRAPYGDFGKSAKEGALLGHTPLGWVVAPDDWKLPGASVIEQRIRDGLKPRAVVLVHDGGGDRKQTIEALESLIPSLLNQGWTFDLPEVTQKAKALPARTPSTPSSPSSPPLHLGPTTSASASEPAPPPHGGKGDPNEAVESEPPR